MRIRTGVGIGPGGIIFTDPRVPSMKFNDDHTFLIERAKEVRTFRLQNPKIYPPDEDGGKWLNLTAIAQEITDVNCARWNNNPNFCLDGSVSALNVSQNRGVTPETKICECGSIMAARVSACCGKIAGWNCPKCGKSI